jgi:hypothetical protein
MMFVKPFSLRGALLFVRSAGLRNAKLLAAFAALSFGLCVRPTAAQTTPITLINPGSEDYTGTGTININPGGVAPIETTGWDSTMTAMNGSGPNGAVQTLTGTPHSGGRRLAFGTAGDGSVPPEDWVLFQQTSHVVVAGEQLILNYWGRGFSNFQNATDDQVSLFGYVDGGVLQPVDTMVHTDVVSGSWVSVGHSFLVPNGSPLVGKNLAIGFYTTALDGTAFSGIDDVTLLTAPGGLPGDADRNGVVNLADAQLIANNFRNSVPVSTLGDLDGSGTVNFADFRMWKDASGFSGSVADALRGVPEPSSVWLTSVAALGILRGVRRRHST